MNDNRPVRFLAAWYAGPGIALVIIFALFVVVACLLYAGALLNGGGFK